MALTSQQAALLSLLADEEGEVRQLVAAQLVARGRAALVELAVLREHAAPKLHERLDDIAEEIERASVDEAFAELCVTFGEHGDLEAAAWKLAATFLPREDFGPARQMLNDWAAEVRRRLEKGSSDELGSEVLAEYLGHEVRLRGNEADYYNVNNSLLPEVIETRRGIPISLSLIYMLVGHRAGLPVEGVGLPGHFIIRCGEAFFDPFHGGRRLGLQDCRALLEQQGAELTPDQLRPASPRQILARMLANIQRISVHSDPPLAAKVGRWMQALLGIREQ